MNDEQRRRRADILSHDQMIKDSRDNGPVPRKGRNDEFDAYVLETFGAVDPDSGVDVAELRKAAWRTWRTAGPSARSSRPAPSGPADDDDLARALELSAQEHRALQGAEDDPIVIDSDDDDELQKALAMSVEEAAAPPKPRARQDTPKEERRMLAEALEASRAEAERPATPFDDSDDDESELDKAMQASREAYREEQRVERETKRQRLEPVAESSKAESSKTAAQRASTASTPTLAHSRNPSPPKPGLSLGPLGIDRAQLERERLARQAARMGTMPDGGKQKEPTTAASSSSTVVSSNNGTSSERLYHHPLQTKGPFPKDAGGEYYPDGELRHTTLHIGQSSTERVFSPRAVFGDPKQMQLLIMSSFVWDEEWMSGFLPSPEQCPTVRVLRPTGGSEIELRHMRGKLRPTETGEVHVYPDMGDKKGSEHMKYAWIFYKTGRLRVAIMTANMVYYDWEAIENAAFVQDFHLRGNRLDASGDEEGRLPDFPDQFRQLFAHLKIHKALKFLVANNPFGGSIPIQGGDDTFKDFAKYDWSRVKVRVVMSIAGTYRGFNDMPKRGICRLAKVIEEEGWQPGKNEKLVAEYQGSSLGRYSIDWYNKFYQSCCGKDLATISRMPKPHEWAPIKVVFPSLATVDASVNGRPGGGTMFCGSSFSEGTKHLFHDANSKRGGVLMHTKMIIALFEPKSSALNMSPSSSAKGKRKADEIADENEGVGGWIYVGSHNFSPSAWGTINFTNKPPTLNINNYELGIVFPLPRGKANAVADHVAPHKRPPRPYGRSDVPWDQRD